MHGIGSRGEVMYEIVQLCQNLSILLLNVFVVLADAVQLGIKASCSVH